MFGLMRIKTHHAVLEEAYNRYSELEKDLLSVYEF